MDILGDFALNQTHEIDCLVGMKALPTNSIDIAITSPPYWGQRGGAGLGLEEDPRDYIFNLTTILLEVMRVLKPEGVLWLNLGDAYNTPINWRHEDYSYSTLGSDRNGLSPSNSAYTKNRGKRRAFTNRNVGWLQYGNLLGLPWRVILNLCDAGMFLRGEVIWSKRKAMPEGRCRRPHRKHESIYIITKNERHSFRITPPVPSVWDLKADPVIDKRHTSTFPLSLPLTCIEATGINDGIIFDPFMGSGTTAIAALMLDFRYIGFELDPTSTKIANERAGSVNRFLPMPF